MSSSSETIRPPAQLPLRQLRVAAVGSPLAGDDAIAIALIERLPPMARVEQLVWGAIDPLDLATELIDDPTPLLLIDAAEMGLQPGEWRLLDGTNARLLHGGSSVSSHGFGIADGVALAAALAPLPPLTIFAIQPADLTPGRAISYSLQQRLPQLQLALTATIDRLLDGSLRHSAIPLATGSRCAIHSRHHQTGQDDRR